MDKEWIRKLTGEDGERFVQIAEMIEQAADDPDHLEQVSVMNLVCGSGKSSGISVLIADTIHAVKMGSREGILIVSDTKKALKKYLEPSHMPLVKKYLDTSKDMISRMDEDTIQDEIFRHKKCPVLLMTYARYFNLKKSQIRNQYLKWGKGNRRTRIIMDEQPPVIQFVTIGNRAVSTVDSELRNGLNREDPEVRAWCLEQWGKIRDWMHGITEKHSAADIKEQDQGFFLETPGDDLLPRSDIRRFIRHVEESRNAIEAEEQGTVDYLDAIIQILREGAYGTVREKAEGNIEVGLYVTLNRSSLLKGLDSKVIIMDGTADIASLYERQLFYRVPCEGVNTRKLENLTVRLININTSKHAFGTRGKEIADFVREYLKTQMNSLREAALITHIREPEKIFIRENMYGAVEHLGNTRGRNDLSSFLHMAQVGLYRKPPFLYTLEFLDQNQEEYGEDSLSAEIRYFPPENVPGFMHVLTNEAKVTYELMIRDAAADFEQNVFRSAIRDPENREPVTYYLFADTNMFSLLVDFIGRRFGENGYGARVEVPDPVAEMIRKIRKRQGTGVCRLINWLARRQCGDIFQTGEMLKEAELTRGQFKSAKDDHPIIAYWFREMNEAAQPVKKGQYMMTEWVRMQLK